MKNICIPLAEGFEEIEAVTLIDVLRRAEFSVTACSLNGAEKVKGAHSIVVEVDTGIASVLDREWDCVVLPGGMPGSDNLRKNSSVGELVTKVFEKGNCVGAVCAAPIVLGHNGVLKGRKATCYPGFEDQLTGAEVCEEQVVVDGNVITSRGPGTVMAFALKITSELGGVEKAEDLKKKMLV